MMATRVLVLSSSLAMRRLLPELITSMDLEVVGSIAEPQLLQSSIKALTPDVLVLDSRMPGSDGAVALERLLRSASCPVVLISALDGRTGLSVSGTDVVDIIGKPCPDASGRFLAYAEDLRGRVRRVRAARCVRVGGSAPSIREKNMAGRALALSEKVLFVGASTGGTEAIKSFLVGMPADCPPTLVVQHMPETFTGSFARRLDSLCAPRVTEAQGNEPLEQGRVFIAPGHSHLLVRRVPSGLTTELSQAAPVNRHRPSVDVLFASAARVVGRNAIGVILTGMGKDGASGLLAMRQAGARTYGQDEASCVVYGMPREAAALGAVEEVASLDDMARRVLAGLQRG